MKMHEISVSRCRRVDLAKSRSAAAKLIAVSGRENVIFLSKAQDCHALIARMYWNRMRSCVIMQAQEI